MALIEGRGNSRGAGPAADPSDGDDALHIQQASTLLGVPAPTLRSWERRYGLPVTLRSAGGHRRYDPAALKQLGRMRDEISVGHRPADAARRILGVVDPDGPSFARIERIIDAAVARDATSLRGVLDGASTEHGLAVTLDDVVMPAMRMVGTWWETGRCDIGDEEFATAVVRGWLAKTVTLAPPVMPDRWVVLATGPADLHTVGLEALAALLAVRGAGCRLLGPRTPTSVLLAAATEAGAAATVVVSHLPTQRRPALESLRAVADAGCPTYYAGNAFLFAGNRRAAAGTYLGETITLAAGVLAETVIQTVPPVPLTPV